MLETQTGLSNIQVKLEEVRGSRYVFQSETNYYFWDSATQEGALVTSPTDYGELLKQMSDNITKVQVKPLEDEE